CTRLKQRGFDVW
nr:immunoglobulin heavy chain junction region [Macaca mulatta]